MLSTQNKFIRTRFSWMLAALLMAVALGLPTGLQAQGNFVYVNHQSTSNSVSGYSISAAGIPTLIPGSPFLTGGTSVPSKGCFASNRIVISTPNNVLYVSNPGSLDISAFLINPSTGGLTSVPGSPFASGLTLDSCQAISLAATPDGRFLMASSNGLVQTFSIAPSGALTLTASSSNCCTPTDSMVISQNGQFLAVANATNISVFVINADGTLTVVAGSPFNRTGSGTLGGLEFSCASDRLYAGEATGSPTITDAWSVGASGALTPIPGSPFSSTGTNSNNVLLSNDNTLLFESNQFSHSIGTFKTNGNGSLTFASSLLNTGVLHEPVGLAAGSSGDYIYLADYTYGLIVMKVVPNTGLSIAGRVAVSTGLTQSLVAYPPRSCTVADIALTKTADAATVQGGLDSTYTITATNNGSIAAPVTVTDTLPGLMNFVSCFATGTGVCTGSAHSSTTTFSSIAPGASETITLVATASKVITDTLTTNSAVQTNRSFVDPVAANNAATAQVKILAPVSSSLTLSPANGTYAGNVTLTATLTRTSDSSPVVGRTVSFKLFGVSVGAVTTDSSGLATVTTSLGTTAVGSYAGAASANFVGDLFFKPSNGSATLTVNPAVLTVTANNGSRVYGDPNPAFTYSIAGFVNGDPQSVVSGTANCSSAATAASPVGSYPIVCTQGTMAATNYSFAFVNGALTVNPAPLSVVADNVIRLYGDPNPSFTGTIFGIKNADNITSTYASIADATSPIGTYSIIPALVDPTSKLSNYTLTSANGTLTITPAPLIVTGANASRFYGDPNPTFAGTITGIKNTDNITATYASIADATSSVGTYPIVATLVDPTGRLSNYVVTNNNGILTVTPSPLTVTTANATRSYGDPNPAFTGTVSGLKNGDSITATYSSAGLTAAVGAYPIVPAPVDPAGRLSNYSVTSVNGTLTIAASPLSISVANATRFYGDTNPAFTGTISGLKNGDNLTAVYSTLATQASSIGNYPISSTLVDPDGKLGNYTVTFTNGSLVITAASLSVSAADSSRAYGDPNPAFTGAINGVKNGDPITVNFSSVATESSPAGTYPIVPALADPAGKLGNYTVTINNGTLTVSASVLTVTGNGASRVYGDANPVFSGVITGLRNGDNITASYSSVADPNSPVGNYAIVPVLADPNGKLSSYTVVINNGTLAVSPASLTVSVASASRLYGDPNPIFTGIISGLKNGDSITAAYSTAADATSPVGAYAIVATLTDPAGKLGNYILANNLGALTITPAPLSVVAASASRLYGDPNPPLPASVSGLKNGDNITAAGATAADATSPVGAYAILPVVADPGSKLGNYTVTAANGTLTVSPAPLSVTTNDASRQVNTSNPIFTGFITGIKNGDDITVTFDTPAVIDSPEGTYPIIPTLLDPGGRLSNYTITSANGTLTITS
jgi:6-phosphogluconolactonase (cycloisomerase 2 family)